MKNLESNTRLKKIPKQPVISKQKEIIENKISIFKEIEENKEDVFENTISEEAHKYAQTEDEIRETQELKCKFAAIVMDRTFLYLALIYSFVTFVALVLSNPNFYKS